MANTLIQLKYSTITDKPSSLSAGEPAYSYTSNTLFIGTPDGLGTINIGGQYYTETLDNATTANTPDTLVLRDAEGSITANVFYGSIVGAVSGTADEATKLETARFFNFTGDVDAVSVSFDGTANADFTLELTNTGVTAATYGGQTKIPTFVVDEDGRITSAANVDVATTLSLSADGATTANIDLLTETLSIVGGDGITSTANATTNSVTFDVDNTVIRTTGNQTITGDFTLNGNLNVQGNTVTYSVESYVVNDPIILLANNNTGNIVDIGFVGHYIEDSNTKHTGLVKNVSTDTYYLFDNYEPHIQEDHILDINDPSFEVANLVVNLVGGTVSGLDSAIAVSDGGTGRNTFTTGAIVIGNGTGGLLELANTTSAGTYGNSGFVPIVTVDDYGRVSSVTTEEIKVTIEDITGILPVVNGGLGANTFTSGQQIVYNGTSFESLANVSTTGSGTLATSNTITSVTTDSYGRLTAFSASAIAIDTSQITSGTLGVARGGTGANTFTTNGVLLGQGTGAITTASSSTEGHILTINASGVPQFQMLSGGTF
jgi:hypothetical protein